MKTQHGMLIGMVLMGLMSVTVRATDYYVSTNGGNLAPFTNWAMAATNLNSAVAWANTNNAGDTVWISNGAYLITATVPVSNIVVRGFDGNRTNVVVNGGNAARCFSVNHSNALIIALTISNGNSGAAHGGGVSLLNGMISNCWIKYNKTTGAAKGGGIYATGNGVIANCRISNNTGNYGGGGIYMYSGGEVRNGCLIEYNYAATADLLGGGIWGEYPGLIRDSTIDHNNGSVFGAGIGLRYSGLITNCQISYNNGRYGGGVALWTGAKMANCLINNNSGSYGGGLLAYSYEGTITHCVIRNNSAYWYGGGAQIDRGTILQNCLIYRNIQNGNTNGTATSGGGGVWANANGAGKTNLIRSCTIVNNTAVANGGGIELRGTTNMLTLLVDSVVYNNTANNGVNHDVFNYIAPTNGNLVSYSCMSDTNGFTGAGNFTNNPQFVYTATNNYRLTEGSPCIDRGLNEAWMNGTVDLDGNNRILGASVDTGAYEAPFVDSDGDGISDGWEGRYGLNPLNSGDAGQDADGDGLTNLQEYQQETNPLLADTDGDGMPDNWEIQYGFNPLDPGDAGQDADGDGKSNLQEYQQGTNPQGGDTDPLSRWKFNEGTGANTVDSATGTNYGALVNMNTNTCWVDGMVGKALSFDGTDDYVSVANDPRLCITNEITLETWIKPERFSDYQLIATKAMYSYGFGLFENQVVMWIYTQSGAMIYLCGQTGLDGNQWYHLAATYRPGMCRVFVNGQPDGVTTCVVSGIYNWPYGLSIGSESSYQSDYFFKGIIDDLRIYNRALDTDEIRSHYQGESNSRAWWKFNEGVSNKVWDSSGADNTGVLTNMDMNTCWVAGLNSQALKFDGSDDYVRVENNPSLSITNNITLETWIKPERFSDYQVIATKGWYTYVIGLYQNKVFMWISGSSGPGIMLYGQTALTSNQWCHLAGTYQPGIASVYVNGQADGVATGAVAGIQTNDSWLSIGSESSRQNDYFFKGIIDDLRIYNRVRTPDELYNAYRDGFTCAQWRFDEGSGTRAYDASGVGNHGALSNMNIAGCWVPGVRDMALQFDGTNDVVVCTNAGSLSATNEICVEAWVKPDTNADYHVIACQGTNYTYFLSTHSGKAFFAAGKADGSDWNAIADGNTTLDSIRWYHLAGTYTPGTARIYVNGAEDGIGAGAVENIYAANAPLTIGGANTTGGGVYSFNGTIDNVGVYQRSLAPGDLYRSYLSGSLCGHWRFDEGSGAMAEDSAMGNVGTLENMSAATCWVMGTIGQGLALDGVNDYVDCGNGASLNITNEISVSAWVKPDTRSGYHMIAAKGDCAYFLATSSGKPYFAIGNANNSGWNVIIQGTNVLNSNLWVHLAGTYNKTDGIGRLYVNGVFDSAVTGTAQTIGANTADLSLGSYSSYTEDYFFQGTLDEIRIYNRALGADEIYTQCQNEGGEYGFGCERNPTGSPIGGGAGYSDVVTSYTYYVTTTSELFTALAAATNGNIVYVDDTASLDVSDYENIVIPGGVTLASGRGVAGSSGALLYTTSYDTFPLFLADGANVRVTGLRLQGPHSGTNIIGEYGDNSGGICCYDPGLEVDNCEISGWPYTGILLDPGATSAYVHHNYIHHCQQMGYGYGVCLGYGLSECLLEANLFDYMRHCIASTGVTNASYEARFNLVLEHANGTSFDQHGCDYDGTWFAGGTTHIHHNTIKTESAAGIRAMPYVGAWIHNNWLYYPSDEFTIFQRGPPDGVTHGNMDVYINVFTTNRVLEIETLLSHIRVYN